MPILFNKTFYEPAIRKGHTLEEQFYGVKLKINSFIIGTKNLFLSKFALIKKKKRPNMV